MSRGWGATGGYKRRILVLSCLALPIACAEEVTEVHVPARVAVEDLRIGSLDGPDEYLFGRVSGIAADHQGRIFVSDLHSHTIRAYRNDGEFLFTVARRGSGPGEVMDPCCLAIAPDGLLWVRDNGNGRYVALEVGDADARGVRTLRMNHADLNRHAPTTFNPRGALIDIGSYSDPETGEARTTLFHFGPDGVIERRVPAPSPPDPDALVHRLPMQVGEVSTIRFFYQPFGPRHLIAYGPGGIQADAVGSTYAVRWFNPDGGLEGVISRPGELGPRLTSAQRTRADSMIDADARRAGRAMPFRAPDRHPVLSALYFDQAGRLWVQRTALPGEPREVDVYDAEGVLVERILYPPGLELSYGVISEAGMVGVVRNELDVPFVVRMRLEPIDGGT